VLDTTGSEPLEGGDAQRLPRLCQMIHTSAAGDGFCRRCVLRAAFQAAGQGGQRAYQCRAGLTLTAAAIRAGDTYLGTLVLGPALCATLPPESADEWATETGLPSHDLRAAGRELPLASEERLFGGARLLASAVAARVEATLHDRGARTVRHRLETLVHEFSGARPTPLTLPPAERHVLEAWEGVAATALAAALATLAADLAPLWASHPDTVRLRLLDLLMTLARRGARGDPTGEVRAALIPAALGVLGLRAWRDVEILVGDLGRDLGRLLAQPAARPTDSRIAQVIRHIHAHYQSDLSLHGMAHSVGLSPQYFCYLFKEQTGASFVQYLRRVRLDHARELLRTGTLEVTEVAFESGFNDVTHFGQTFKAAEGLTPSQYRRQGAWVRHLPIAPAAPARGGPPPGAPSCDGP